MAEIKTLELGNVDSSTSVETRATAPTRRNHGTGMKKWKKVTLVTVAIAAIIGLAIGGVVWSHRGVVTVQTGKVQRQDLAQIVTANGEIKPVEQNQANVNANSIGKITEILVKEGDHVTKGQLLMRTEDVQQAASVEAQQAAVTTSQADLVGAGCQRALRQGRARYRTGGSGAGRRQAESSHAKISSAGSSSSRPSLISQQDFDQRLSDYRVAQTGKDSSEAQVGQAKAQYQQALYNRDSARAQVGQSKAQLLGLQKSACPDRLRISAGRNCDFAARPRG